MSTAGSVQVRRSALKAATGTNERLPTLTVFLACPPHHPPAVPSPQAPQTRTHNEQRVAAQHRLDDAIQEDRLAHLDVR